MDINNMPLEELLIEIRKRVSVEGKKIVDSGTVSVEAARYWLKNLVVGLDRKENRYG